MVEHQRQTPVFSVSELSQLLDGELERSFKDIWVEGEVSNFSKSPSGHLYFRLKDKEAVLKVAIFRQTAIRVIFQIENGMVLLLRGKLGYYGKSGDLQLYAAHAEPYGAGALQMALEQAKKRLQAEGLADPLRKRAIPSFPKKVGVVTSLEGAAIKDIISILKRRQAPFEVIISSSPVQGDQAPAEIKKAMERLLKVPDVDIIVLTRGGGSFEDLNAFNDESLARFIALSPVPVISAVGHEIDVVLTDLTADLRAPTPSAAAEIMSQPFVSIRERVASLIGLAGSAISNRIAFSDEKLSVFDSDRAFISLLRRVDRLEERRDRASARLAEKVSQKFYTCTSKLSFLDVSLRPKTLLSMLSAAEKRMSFLARDLAAGSEKILLSKENQMRNLARILEVKNPLAILSRGYSILKDKSGRAVRSASQVEAGDNLDLLLFEGRLTIIVEEKD
jgi:exodeoxyribonuclease VII large subunit